MTLFRNQLAYLVETFVRRKQRWLITWTSNAHLAMLENAHTGVGGPEVDADSGLLGHDARVDLVVEWGGLVRGWCWLGCVGWSEWRGFGCGLSTPGGSS